MTRTTLKYAQIRTLRTRGPVEQEPDREVDGLLLVGDRAALAFEDRHSAAGCDAVTIYPAFTGAEPFQCWLVHRRWHAAHGYSASGVQEQVISFTEGVQIFLERGVFALAPPAPPEVPADTDASVTAPPTYAILSDDGGYRVIQRTNTTSTTLIVGPGGRRIGGHPIWERAGKLMHAGHSYPTSQGASAEIDEILNDG